MTQTPMTRLLWLSRTHFFNFLEIHPIAQENKFVEIFREIFLIYHEYVCCVFSLESPH